MFPIPVAELIRRIDKAGKQAFSGYMTCWDKAVARILDEKRVLMWAPFRGGDPIAREIKSKESSSAALLHRRGVEVTPCSNCQSLGPFTKCVVAPAFRGNGLHRGACSCCLFYHHGAYCTHRESFLAGGGRNWTEEDTDEVISAGGLLEAIILDGDDGLWFTRGEQMPARHRVPRPRPRARRRAQRLTAGHSEGDQTNAPASSHMGVGQTQSSASHLSEGVQSEPSVGLHLEAEETQSSLVQGSEANMPQPYTSHSLDVEQVYPDAIDPSLQPSQADQTAPYTPWLTNNHYLPVPPLHSQEMFQEPMDPMSFCGAQVADSYWDYSLTGGYGTSASAQAPATDWSDYPAEVYSLTGDLSSGSTGAFPSQPGPSSTNSRNPGKRARKDKGRSETRRVHWDLMQMPSLTMSHGGDVDTPYTGFYRL